MNLNGQCEKAFNEWCISEFHEPPMNEMWLADYDPPELVYNQRLLKHYPHEMQHGVKVKFFDSVGIYLETAWIPEMGCLGM